MGTRPGANLACPLRGDVTISYLSAADTWTDLDPGDFRVSERTKSIAIYWESGFAFPSLYTTGDAVRIDFEAGYDLPGVSASDTAGQKPDGLEDALLGIVAYQYEKRGAGRDTLRFSNLELDPILAAYKQFW